MMTKVGEGEGPREASQAMYHKQLQDSIIRFQFALQQTQNTKNLEEKEHFTSVMDQQIGLIQSAINEIKRLGIHKQGEIVISDYEHYQKDPSAQNLTALQQDIYTLKEYNFSPNAHAPGE
jgi:hypothetical protein